MLLSGVFCIPFTMKDDLVDQLQGLSQGRSSVYHIVKNYISQIEKANSQYNVFIDVFESDALASAEKLDKEMQSQGPSTNLYGAALAIKDNIWIKDYRTTAGLELFKDYFPKEDAKVISELRRLKSVFLGKTNMHALALGATSASSFFGPVLNPFDKSRVAGGSSGGSAAAVALNMCAAALGTDTGGSIRIPAAFCGVVGFKPSFGRLSTEGVFPLSWMLDHVGIIGHSVRDCYLVFKSLVSDAKQQNLISLEDSNEYAQQARKLRFGIAENYCQDLDQKVEKDFNNTLDKIRKFDCEVIPIDLPDPDEGHVVRSRLMLKESSTIYSKEISRSPGEFPEDVLELLKTGSAISGDEYESALQSRSEIINRVQNVFNKVDYIVTPTEPILAPKLEEVSGRSWPILRPKLVRNTGLFNVTGMPAISLPIGKENGLCTSLQVAANYLQDENLLRVASFLINLIEPAL